MRKPERQSGTELRRERKRDKDRQIKTERRRES